MDLPSWSTGSLIWIALENKHNLKKLFKNQTVNSHSNFHNLTFNEMRSGSINKFVILLKLL